MTEGDMTPFEQFLRWLVTISVWDVAKVLVIVGLGLYLVFAIVMVRQVGLMRQTVEIERDWWVTLVAWIHLVVTVVVLVVAAMML